MLTGSLRAVFVHQNSAKHKYSVLIRIPFDSRPTFRENRAARRKGGQTSRHMAAPACHVPDRSSPLPSTAAGERRMSLEPAAGQRRMVSRTRRENRRMATRTAGENRRMVIRTGGRTGGGRR